MTTSGVDPAKNGAEQRLRAVVAHAEQLVESARQEASQLVQEAQTRSQALMDDANRLREMAEHEAQEILVEAERLRSSARRESETLLEETQSTHDAAMTEARSMIDDSARSLSSTRDTPSEAQAADRAQQIITDASDTADRILRVARSEAEARTRELLDKTRRKVEQAEADARSRLDMLQRQYRQRTRDLQQEELDLRVRIQQLTMELSSLERGIPPVGSSSLPAEPDGEPEVTALSTPRGEDVARSEARPSSVWEAVPRPVNEPIDEDTMRALRSIRRRA